MFSIAWLASYPKSGNTWARAMLANYLLGRQVTSIGDGLGDLIPDYHQLLKSGMMVPHGDYGQVIAKTHFLPGVQAMQEYRESTGKAVYLVRNPRDVILSSARALGIVKEKRGMFAKYFIAHHGVFLRNGMGTWQESVRAWTSLAAVRQFFPGADVLTVKYEDMRADPVLALGRIIQFLDLGGPDDKGRVERAVENASLARMRVLEERDGTTGIQAFADADRSREPFVGKGLTNQSLSGLGADVEEAYRQWLHDDEEFRRCVKEFGYEG